MSTKMTPMMLITIIGTQYKEIQSKMPHAFKSRGRRAQKITLEGFVTYIHATFKLFCYATERTRGGLKPFLSLSANGSPGGVLGRYLPGTGWVHLHIIFLEPVQTGANQLLTCLLTQHLLDFRRAASVGSGIIQSPRFLCKWGGTRLFLYIGIDGPLERTYFPMHPLKIATGIRLLKTGQKHATGILLGSAQLHSWSVLAVALEGSVEESLVDGGVDGLTKLMTYILSRI